MIVYVYNIQKKKTQIIQKGCTDCSISEEDPIFLERDSHFGDEPPKHGFAHTQTTHPNNLIYLSPEDEWKHWLYAVILTLSFQGFRVLGFRVLGGFKLCCFGK